MPTLFVNGEQRQYEKGTSFLRIAQEFQPKVKARIALCYYNSKMRELTKKVDKDGVLTFITTKDAPGHAAYARTATMMLVKAANDIGKKEGRNFRVKVEFTIGKAYFCTLHGDVDTVDEEMAAKLQTEMEKIRDAALPITKKTYPIDDAIALFHYQGMRDKERLFHYRRSSTINVYCLDGFYDYFYGYMLPSTDYVDLFEVLPYKGGLLLNIPGQESPDELTPFTDEPKLFEQLMLSTKWGDLVDISTVGDLNDKICSGNVSDMILVQEALQERRIGDIAEQIVNKGNVKFVLVAGPSSSGKTTFAHRLGVQLRSFGKVPHIISMDNWFVSRDKTPIDIDGNYNFDVIEALDLDLFNADMSALLAGETIDLPTYDFRYGKRVYKGNKMKLGESDILIIEGIHGLNPRTSEDLPEENKFRIYISALTSLNVDGHNRIPTSDTRLLRRIVRDARIRSNSAEMTIIGWKKVREGEEKNIFPYQNNVDAIFNSNLIYEQAVLKQFAEPLLFGIPQNSPAYYEAKRLLKFLDYFVGVDTASLPANSICREFVGGGCFPV